MHTMNIMHESMLLTVLLVTMSKLLFRDGKDRADLLMLWQCP